jgi:hypothetical protein
MCRGVPASGVIDSGGEITIMGAELFEQIASVARLTFKKSNKIPYLYNNQIFPHNGKLESSTTTPMYMKMETRDALRCAPSARHHPVPSRRRC